MKKLMIAALMLLATGTAFAGNSDQLKAVLGAKTLSEAESLLKQNLNGMTDNAEKAKAYNHLVDLAMKQFDEQNAKQLANQTKEQLGQKDKLEPYDTVAMNEGAYAAVLNAIECNKYDQLPNEKGKVKPAFAQANAQRVWPVRVTLVNAGQEAARKQDTKSVLKFWSLFVDSDDDPLFAGQDKKMEESFFGQVARFAGVYAYQAKDYARAEKYADIAMKDPKEAKDALNLKIGVMQAQLKTAADSANFTSKVRELYDKDHTNNMLFGTLVNFYTQGRDTTNLNKLLDEKEAEDPQNFVVHAVRGQNYMIAQELDKAIESFRKALEVQPENPQILSYMGACLFDRAQKAEERAAGTSGRIPPAARQQIEPLFKEAETDLEKAKSLDPDHENSNWPYALYRVYYRLYGPTDARTVEAEKLTH